MAPLHAHTDSRPGGAAAAVSHGSALTFETLADFGDGSAPERRRPWEDTLLRVLDGVVRLSGDRERRLGIGQEVIIPAGARHRLSGVDGEARVVMGFRRAR
jgi:hypothetical protein